MVLNPSRHLNPIAALRLVQPLDRVSPPPTKSDAYGADVSTAVAAHPLQVEQPGHVRPVDSSEDGNDLGGVAIWQLPRRRRSVREYLLGVRLGFGKESQHVRNVQVAPRVPNSFDEAVAVVFYFEVVVDLSAAVELSHGYGQRAVGGVSDVGGCSGLVAGNSTRLRCVVDLVLDLFALLFVSAHWRIKDEGVVLLDALVLKFVDGRYLRLGLFEQGGLVDIWVLLEVPLLCPHHGAIGVAPLLVAELAPLEAISTVVREFELVARRLRYRFDGAPVVLVALDAGLAIRRGHLHARQLGQGRGGERSERGRDHQGTYHGLHLRLKLNARSIDEPADPAKLPLRLKNDVVPLPLLTADPVK